MGIVDWADGVLDRVEGLRDGLGQVFEPSLRLGVTGLSGAGKTVFITALVASLLDRGRMRLLRAQAEGRIQAVDLRPQPDPAVPRFAFEAHLARLRDTPPAWPQSTSSVSQLRVAIRYRPGGLIGALTGAQVLNLDIVDYPGEWLLDLSLMGRDYADWAAEALALAESPARAAQAGEWHAALAAADPGGAHDEGVAAALAGAYARYLAACRVAGLSALAPGRFLMPGDMAGSPALTFAPLPPPPGGRVRRGGLYDQMARRFDAYGRVVVRPFFQNHFARLDAQVVLIDALGALAAGPRALGDLTATMADTLAAFRHGSSSWLDRLLGGRRIGRLLFAASKADHLHHDQHPRMTQLVEAMLAEAARRATWSGAETRAMAIAAIRATVEQDVAQPGGGRLGLVRGPRLGDGRAMAIHPGDLPRDVGALIAAARISRPGEAPADWPDGDFAALRFAPPVWGGDGGGPPHIRLDAALDFLLGPALA